ncbi:MAG: transglycosylase domain-containing protein [Sphingomonadales bacterium]|nr:transglycosylase domain-containing protein [Sphingomonadales bacterium]MBD3772260.1 transglycosylase domain-containing protein [Paracoccaceae bacterium]
MADTSANEPLRYRIRREASGILSWAGARLEWLAPHWREKRWLRWGTYLLGIGLAALILGWVLLARGLPDAKTLLEYEPPLPTMVRGADGEIVDSYARERRVQLQYADFPPVLIDAYLAAEDKTFFSHGGIDFGGFASAVIDYLNPMRSGRAVGGSTITQQVAKNILIGDEYSVTRKLKEMILARRIEGVLNKQQILELYLNEIPLGRRAYGVQAAARAYFNKDVADLDLQEAAFLAILPKAPEVYGRKANEARALERRNWVLDQMVDNGFVTRAAADQAKAKPLGLVAPGTSDFRRVDAGYFLEEVRRDLIGKFGETAEDGKNSVYAGGLWVRTSLDPQLQVAARDALRTGMLRYHGGRGWAGPVATLDAEKGDLKQQLASSNIGISYKNWRIGVVLSRNGSDATIGFSNGEEGRLGSLPAKLKVGDVTAVTPSGNGWQVQAIPEVSGGMVVEDPQRGRILAMQGGFDSRLGSFNRATQAKRQPGSTIKPFVYATGLDNGMTPATEVPDQTFCYYQGAKLGQKCFRNSGGGGGGIHPMRWGLEQSRNLMTIHIAMETGMPKVVKTFKTMGIGDYPAYPAFALGAGETTVLDMVNAYSALADNGRLHKPTLIDYVQDRRGKVIWRADTRPCTGCNMPEWDGSPMPRLGASGVQAMDPRTAFQVVHMLQGVVQRGTAKVLRDLKLPLFGKTGTTTGPKETWFVGGTQDMVAGVYLGFDKPRNMGGYAQGGTIGAPIFKQFVQETFKRWNADPLVAPAGVRMVRIDRASGKRVFEGWPGNDPMSSVIWEAFKPDTEPPRATRQDRIAAKRDEVLALIRKAREGAARGGGAGNREEPPADFVEEQGGIY